MIVNCKEEGLKTILNSVHSHCSKNVGAELEAIQIYV